MDFRGRYPEQSELLRCSDWKECDLLDLEPSSYKDIAFNMLVTVTVSRMHGDCSAVFWTISLIDLMRDQNLADVTLEDCVYVAITAGAIVSDAEKME